MKWRPLCFFTLIEILFAYATSAQEAPRALPLEKPKLTPKVLVALPNYDEETSTRLQIFLDNNYFAPGKIDGKMGEFFRKALVCYKFAHKLPLTGAIDSWLIEQVPQAYTTYTIRPEDLNLIGPAPSRPSEQSKLKALRYGSLLEFVAERYHSAEEYIQKLNPGKDWEHLNPGEELKVPNVIPFEIATLTEAFVPENPALAKRKVFILTKERVLEVYEGDQMLFEFPITPGSTKLPAPKGEAILVPKDSKLTSVADLRGKKVALNKGSNVHYLLVKALEKAGVKYSEVEPVFLAPADARAAFERGAVDAWVIWDPFQAAAEAATGARTLADGTGVVSNYQFYFSSKKFLESDARIVDLVLAELSAVDDWAKGDIHAVANQLAPAIGLPVGVVEVALKRQSYGIKPVTDSVIADQQRVADTFFALGLLPKQIKISDAARRPGT
jgi:LysM repeat protein